MHPSLLIDASLSVEGAALEQSRRTLYDKTGARKGQLGFCVAKESDTFVEMHVLRGRDEYQGPRLGVEHILRFLSLSGALPWGRGFNTCRVRFPRAYRRGAHCLPMRSDQEPITTTSM